MDAKTCLKTRRSVRRFQDQPVSRELISEVVATAQFAPTWKNSQTVRYVYIDDPVLKARIADEATMNFAKNKDNITGAAGLMVLATVHGIAGFNEDGSFSSDKGEHWESFDAGICTQTLCLALHEAGLGSVIMGLFDSKKVAELAQLPEGWLVSCIMAVGYPAEGEHGKAVRKPLDEVLSFR